MVKTLFAAVSFIFMTLSLHAQTPYTNTLDGETHILNGIVSKYILQNDTSFKWYATNQKGYAPDTAAVSAMETNKNKVRYVVFGGTWCGDTKNILPKFFKLQETSGVPDANISFFAMDRSKKTIGNVGDAFNITNVPTIIVMKNGKEVGRVVEYGTSGKFDKDLAEILRN